jgi:4-carboxymuconolactone decarboxylase
MWSDLIFGLVSFFAFGIATVAMGRTKPSRFPDLDRDQMTDAQRRVYDAIASGPRGRVPRPFQPLLRSPELADQVQKLGEYVRFKTSVPARLNEFAILINARFMDCQFEWFGHKPLVIKNGIAESILDDLAQNKRPKGMKPDEELVYDFCTTLSRQHSVDDELFQRAVATLGEQGVIDLIAVSGFFIMMSLAINVAELPIPPGEKPPW